MAKDQAANFMSAEQFEAALSQMLAQGLITDIYDAAEVLGVARRTVNRARQSGGDRMLSLACSALVHGAGVYFIPEDVAELPKLPKYAGRGRPEGSKDRAPRRTAVETPEQMRERIEAEVRAKYGITDEESEAA